MPKSDKLRRWSEQETIDVLKVINDNFTTWKDNRSAACIKAAEAVPDRDAKSVYNRVHNLIKTFGTMDDDNKKKPNDPIWSNKKFLNLLRKIRTKGENEEDIKVENGSWYDPIHSLVSDAPSGTMEEDDHRSNDTIDVEKAEKYKLFDAKYKEFEELPGQLKKYRSELKEMEEEVASMKDRVRKKEERFIQLKQLFESE